MIKKHYDIELEGKTNFFDKFHAPYDNDGSILADNADCVYNGNILEFRLNIADLDKALFRAIRNCSKMRIRGESVPARILLVDLNDTLVYEYRSEDYRDAIQIAYVGGASKDNAGFSAGDPIAKYDYFDMIGFDAVRKMLTDKKPIQDMYMPIDIDENCIVGWAERYYREVPEASKGDFLGDDTGDSVQVIGEIRDPKHFKGLIRPYTGKTNEKFKALMDQLNDKRSQKGLGAFYTPEPYAKKSAELVQMAVERVPDGNDYIILDRCAGTGNLEVALIGLLDKNGDELISHCISSTYEFFEYEVLQERIGDKVRGIIPPTEAGIEYEDGKVSNADAMSEDYIENPLIKKYVDDNSCTIILFENPPYRDVSSNSTSKATGKKDSFVLRHMREEIKGVATNDMSNLFIWSGFKYYLRQPADSYIVFSPIKYWKTCHLCDKKCMKGYLFNREHFHASSSSAISCILWANDDDLTDQLIIDAIDIQDDELCISAENIKIKKAYKTMTAWFDHRKTYDFIGYMNISGYNFDSNSVALYRAKEQLKGHGSCFYLYADNYMEKLPLFCAKLYPFDNWYEKDIYATTSDGGDAYKKDREFLKACLIYTCLSNQNKCLTFDVADGQYYQNELCFDDGTVASKDLKQFTLDEDEQDLMDIWHKIIEEARTIATAEGYPRSDALGVYQITHELNTSHKEGTGKHKKNVYDHPELNKDLRDLRIMLKEYYRTHITKKMFQYELIK